MDPLLSPKVLISFNAITSSSRPWPISTFQRIGWFSATLLSPRNTRLHPCTRARLLEQSLESSRIFFVSSLNFANFRFRVHDVLEHRLVGRCFRAHGGCRRLGPQRDRGSRSHRANTHRNRHDRVPRRRRRRRRRNGRDHRLRRWHRDTYFRAFCSIFFRRETMLKMMMMITPTIDVAFLSRRLFARRPTTRDGQRTPLNAHRGGARRIHDDDDDFASSSCARLLLRAFVVPSSSSSSVFFLLATFTCYYNSSSFKRRKNPPLFTVSPCKKEGAHIIEKKKGPRDLLDSFLSSFGRFFFLCVCVVSFFSSLYRAL